MKYSPILEKFVKEFALPAMQQEYWTTKPAKCYGFQGTRGPEHHIDQPLVTHILNGLYALTRVVQYLADKNYYKVSEKEFKLALVLYTLHDAYKDPVLGKTRLEKSDFSVPLPELESLIERMKLRDFVKNFNASDARLASVSLLSNKYGDMAGSSPEISPVLTLIHLADSLASQQTARDYKSAERRLVEIYNRSGAILQLMNRRALSSDEDDDSDVASLSIPKLAMYYHELDEYRGISTLMIHQATAEVLEKTLNLYPILYFANAILYIGPAGQTAEPTQLRKAISAKVFELINKQLSNYGPSIAANALDYGQSLKFQKYVYLFCKLDDLLSAIQDRPLPEDKKNVGFVSRILTKRVQTQKYNSADEFYTLYNVESQADGYEGFATRWYASFVVLMGIDNIARSLIGDSFDWLLKNFKTPEPVAAAIRQNKKLLGDGGITDYLVILAYHWLKNTTFEGTGGRQYEALEIPVTDIKTELLGYSKSLLDSYDNADRRLEVVEGELGVSSDLENYLQTNLVFSFAATRQESVSNLGLYEKPRTYSHKKVCLICNRKAKSDIITSIAEQQAQVFSNRLLPAEEVGGQMVWCSMCYLEFMLRKLSGVSYPEATNTNSSYRLYLYVLPDYSFTPELWEFALSQLITDEFGTQDTVVSKLRLRGNKEEPSIPTQWLNNRQINAEWFEQVRQAFAEQARRLRGQSRRKGDALTFKISSPNYMLLSYANVVSERDDAKLAPTHAEVWAKALYTALFIHLLTGVRVYITDKPYLSISRPEEMKTIIEMEGLHPLLYGVLPVALPGTTESTLTLRPSESAARLPISHVPIAIDVLSALWEITAALNPGDPTNRRNVDKQIAQALHELKNNHFAGATLYKERFRDQKAGSYEEFVTACRILLPYTGGEPDEVRGALKANNYWLMIDQEGEKWMNLAEELTALSLQLYLPTTGSKGRAHRYETIFRTGIEVIKSNASLPADEMVPRIAGNLLKRLTRMGRGAGAKPAKTIERPNLAEAFARLLVEKLFIERCGKSLSKLTHEENHMADAIFFLTAQRVNQAWTEYIENKKRNPEDYEDADEDESPTEAAE